MCRSVRAGLALSTLAIALTACTTDSGRVDASTSSTGPSSGRTSSAVPSTAVPSTGAATVSPSASLQTPSVPSSPAPTASAVEYLCQAAQTARDVADAYVGALGAGDLDQALACVAPDAADARARTPSLLATGSTQGVAYQLDESRSSGSLLVYTGRATITITITSTGGHLWVGGVQ